MVLNLFLWPTVCYMGHKLRIRPPTHCPPSPMPSVGPGADPWVWAGQQLDPDPAMWGWKAAGTRVLLRGARQLGALALGQGLSTRYRLAARTPKGEPRMEPPPQKPGGAAALWQIPSSLAPHPLTAQSPLQKPTHRPTLPPRPPEALTCPLLAGALQQSA
ncbi:hypothetical protein KIL84_012278 [Mauremys mutica]|uniref:Uncharacterized protein n=1 Tax=Mauremys mutica TaxID=74926 RepID=A0A9D4B324_9SAUR|nr:hypothetical protein KIL84_012278 [Mauremys mutica]